MGNFYENVRAFASGQKACREIGALCKIFFPGWCLDLELEAGVILKTPLHIKG